MWDAPVLPNIKLNLSGLLLEMACVDYGTEQYNGPVGTGQMVETPFLTCVSMARCSETGSKHKVRLLLNGRGAADASHASPLGLPE